MPHLRILFKTEKVKGESINALLPELIKIVGRHFDENPDYVSADVVEQSSWVLNRKDIDIELDSSPDSAGKRASAAFKLAEELGNFLKAELEKNGAPCEVSAWVRIFSQGDYAYIG